MDLKNLFKQKKFILILIIIIIIILFICTYFLINSGNKNVDIPKDAVTVYYDDPHIKTVEISYSNTTQSISSGEHITNVTSNYESIEMKEYINDSSYFKINGTNNYAVPIDKALRMNYTLYSSLPTTSSNIGVPHDRTVEGLIVFYDKDKNIVTNQKVRIALQESEYGGIFIGADNSSVNETPIYSSYTNGGMFPTNMYDTDNSAELHLIVKANVSESSPDYYCYDFVFPAHVRVISDTVPN